VLDSSPQAEAALKTLKSLTINAVLNYQTCDDKVCLTPQSVPLTWTVNVRPLDRQRVKQ
jgi:hypothetical protein